MFQTFVFAWCDIFCCTRAIFWFILHLQCPTNYQKTFSKVHLSTGLSHPQRARVARASAVFRFLPSPLHHTNVRIYETVTYR